jgi:tetratricopeptide (TPR) repeat protein
MKSAIIPEQNSEEENPMEIIFWYSMNRILKDSEPVAFLNWFTAYIPKVCDYFGEMELTHDHTEQDTKAMWRGLGRMIYAQIPIPSNDYRLKKIPEPGRNDSCDCGSGSKYKHCCADANQTVLAMPMFNGLRFLLEMLKPAQLADIASTHADLLAVAETAHTWTDSGKAKHSVMLLEPYFKGETPLSSKLDLLFDELMSALYELNKPRKRENLIKQVLLRGDKALQSAALQRRATIHCDLGLYDEAWVDFKAAFERNPNDPSLSHLEVLILTSQGNLEQAKVRAQYWVKYLKALRDERHTDLIAYLEKSASNPVEAGLHAARKMYPELDELCLLLAQSPAPQSHYSGTLQTPHHERYGGQSIGTLKGTPMLNALQTRWQSTFRQVKPMSTYVQNNAEDVWKNAADWLKLLKQEPQLWNCFDVIDDLVMATECLPVHSVVELVTIPLAERAAELLQLTLEKFGKDPAQQMQLRCEWIVGENRSALRPIAHLTFLCKDLGKADRFMNLAHWFVFGLNPNDNHGFRDDLSNAFICEDRNQEVLQICDTYPEDAPNLALNGVLACYRLGQLNEAAAALKTTHDHYPKAVKMLLKASVKAVKPDGGGGILVGGNYQAWLYYEAMQAQWMNSSGSIAWAKTVLK